MWWCKKKRLVLLKFLWSCVSLVMWSLSCMNREAWKGPFVRLRWWDFRRASTFSYLPTWAFPESSCFSWHSSPPGGNVNPGVFHPTRFPFPPFVSPAWIFKWGTASFHRLLQQILYLQYNHNSMWTSRIHHKAHNVLCGCLNVATAIWKMNVFTESQIPLISAPTSPPAELWEMTTSNLFCSKWNRDFCSKVRNKTTLLQLQLKL